VPEKDGLRDIKLDDIRPESLQTIQDLTEAYCKDKNTQKRLEQFAEMLVEHRRSRKHSPLWPWVSSGNQYRCVVPDCPRQQKLHLRKDEFEYHFSRRHSDDPEFGKKKWEDMAKIGMVRH